MSLGNVNGKDIKTQIHSIASSGNAGSRKGRIEILEKVSELGKELLDALNSQDENLVELENDYDDIFEQFEELDNEIKAAEEKAQGIADGITDIDEEIADLEAKKANGEELSDFDQTRLEYLYKVKSGKQEDASDENSHLTDLAGKKSTVGAKLDGFGALLNDITEKMDGYAEAGDEVKDAAHTYGRSNMAENMEKNGGALKRNESMWGKTAIHSVGGSVIGGSIGGIFGPVGFIVGAVIGGVGGIVTGATTKNDTEKYVERMGYRGMGDGGEGSNMTYHDDEYGGYHAEYDVMQYGIGGKLRDLTAKTWSYGKTVNTASNDMKNRAETLDGKRKPDDEPKDNQNL